MKDNEPSPKTAYEVRTVAFIDILGFSALVARSVEDRNFLTNLYQAVRVVENQGRIWAALSLSSPGASREQAREILTAMDFRSHAFSDCLILSQRGARCLWALRGRPDWGQPLDGDEIPIYRGMSLYFGRKVFIPSPIIIGLSCILNSINEAQCR